MNRFLKIIMVMIVFISIVLIFISLGLRSQDTGDRGDFVNLRSSDLQINNNIEEKQFGFPTSVSEINISLEEQLSEEQILEIADQLGFDGDPLVANDTYDGRTYIWRGEQANLTVYARSRTARYSLKEYSVSGNADFSEEWLDAAATTFLSNNGFYDPEEITTVSVEYYKADTETLRESSAEDANTAVVGFIQSNITEFPVISRNPKFSPIEVWITKSGEISRVIMNIVDFTTSDEIIEIKNFAEFNRNIDNSSLISIDEGNIEPLTLYKSEIGTINANNVELGYFYDYPRTDTLSPIFIITGTGMIRDEEGVPVTMYLPAEK